jgi:LDH2 family malate/lactate/ureidoglycolate dehydrogenase
MRYHFESLAAFCVAVLIRAGMTPEDSRLVSEALVTADAWGKFSQGTKNLPRYIKGILAGDIDPKAIPVVEREGPGWAIVNGNRAIGIAGCFHAMEAAIAKARQCGIGYAGLKNIRDSEPGTFFAFQAADQGMIGIAMSSSAGGRALLRGNTLAYAIPLRGNPPLLLDSAATESGETKEVLTDGGKQPTSEEPFADGASEPSIPGDFLCINLLIETLASVLTGAALQSHLEDSGPGAENGAAFIAVNTETIAASDHFQERLAEWVRQIRRAPKETSSRILLPGEEAWQNREESLHTGIPLPKDVAEGLRALGAETGMPFETFFSGGPLER